MVISLCVANVNSLESLSCLRILLLTMLSKMNFYLKNIHVPMSKKQNNQQTSFTAPGTLSVTVSFRQRLLRLLLRLPFLVTIVVGFYRLWHSFYARRLRICCILLWMCRSPELFNSSDLATRLMLQLSRFVLVKRSVARTLRRAFGSLPNISTSTVQS